MYGVEANGLGIDTPNHAAPLQAGRVGVSARQPNLSNGR